MRCGSGWIGKWMQRARGGGGGGESHRRRSARRARFETAALGSPASDESTVGTALGDPWQCSADCSSCYSLVVSVATTVALVAPRPANGAKGERVAEVVPRFFASGSQEGARGWSSAKRECSRSRRLEELCLMCLMHRVCGRAQASTDSGRRAPFALGDDVERA